MNRVKRVKMSNSKESLNYLNHFLKRQEIKWIDLGMIMKQKLDIFRDYL